MNLTNSHFVQLFPLCAGTHILSIFNIYALRNSRIVRYNSGFGGQSDNSHFVHGNSGIIPILTLRRTDISLVLYNALVNIRTDLQTVIYYSMITARVIYFLNNLKSFFLPIALHPLLRIMRCVHCAARFTAVLYKDSYKFLPNLFEYVVSSLQLS